jgi:hypothetical protein
MLRVKHLPAAQSAYTTATPVGRTADNTIPGSDAERGLTVWQTLLTDSDGAPLDWWEDDHLNRVSETVQAWAQTLNLGCLTLKHHARCVALLCYSMQYILSAHFVMWTYVCTCVSQSV